MGLKSSKEERERQREEQGRGKEYDIYFARTREREECREERKERKRSSWWSDLATKTRTTRVWPGDRDD